MVRQSYLPAARCCNKKYGGGRRCDVRRRRNKKRRREKNVLKSQRNEKAKFRVNQCEGCNLSANKAVKSLFVTFQRSWLLTLFNNTISNMDPSSIAPHDVESGYGHVLRHLAAFACKDRVNNTKNTR